MRRAHALPFIDWVAISLRWIFLFSTALVLALEVGFSNSLLLTLILGALGVSAVTALIITFPGGRWIRAASLLGDELFALSVFYLSATFLGDMGWLGLLPVLSASLYFNLHGWVVSLLLTLALQMGIATLDVSLLEMVLPLGALFVLYLLVGGFTAFIAHRYGDSTFWLRRLQTAGIIDQSPREQRRAIYDLIVELSASLNYHQVLEKALDLSQQTLAQLSSQAGKLVSGVFLFTQDNPSRLELVAQRGFIQSDLPLVLRGRAGFVKSILEDGQPALTLNVTGDRELKNIISLHKCRAVYGVPLRSGLDTYGFVLFAHPQTSFFSKDAREVLDIIGSQSMIAMQNARLYQDLEAEKERMMEIQEEARNKMARDLHDGPTQSIAAMAMRVNFARRLMERNPAAAEEELYKIEELARRTTKEIRHMLFTLRPLVLESQGLVAALQSMAEKMRDTYDQEVLIEAENTLVERLEASKQAVVFYIAEEAVNNARKHAQAEHIWVRLKSLRNDLALLEVEDDGVGFDVNAVNKAYEERGSLGMVNMRERSELVEGVLRINSLPGRGTRVQVVIPLTDEAAHQLHRGL